MNLKDVRLTRTEKLKVYSRALYDFLYVRHIMFTLLITGVFLYYGDTIFANDKGATLPLWGQFSISIIIAIMLDLCMLILVPLLYNEFIKETMFRSFKDKLTKHEYYMKEEVLKRADEIILQQKRQ